jgi:hypothetical protein
MASAMVSLPKPGRMWLSHNNNNNSSSSEGEKTIECLKSGAVFACPPVLKPSFHRINC